MQASPVAYYANAFPVASTSAVPYSGQAASPLLAISPKPKKDEQAPGQAQGQVKKSRRKQYSSCDACRLRKVKCVKTDPTNPVCDGCQNKQIHCSNAYEKELQTGKGKRIDEARQAYGEVKHVETVNKSSTGDAQEERPLVMVLKVTRTPETSMNNKVLSTQALSFLLEAYKRDVSWNIVSTDYDRLLSVCSNANFDLDQLDIFDQILCLAVAGTAAGCQAPRHLTNGQELSTDHTYDAPPKPQGTGQPDPATTSRAILEKIVELTDKAGLHRQPSHRSMQALRLLMILSSGQECRRLRRSPMYRSFESSYMDHLRELTFSGELDEEKQQVFFWSAILGDAFACAVSGFPPNLTYDDLDTFADFVPVATLDILGFFSTLNQEFADAGYGLAIAEFAKLCYQYYDRVSSIKARRRPFLDLDMIHDALSGCDRIFGILEALERQLELLFPQGLPEKFRVWSIGAGVMVNNLNVTVLHELDFAILNEMQASLPRVQALQDALSRATWRFVDICLKDVYAGLQRSWILATSDALPAFFVVMRLKRILRLPTGEEGAPNPVLTMAAKAEYAQQYLRMCIRLAEVNLEVREELPALTLDVMDLAAKALHTSSREYSAVSSHVATQAQFTSYPTAPQFSTLPNFEAVPDPFDIPTLAGPQGPDLNSSVYVDPYQYQPPPMDPPLQGDEVTHTPNTLHTLSDSSPSGSEHDDLQNFINNHLGFANMSRQ